MADDIVASVVEKLGNALIQELRALREFNDQLRNIKTQLSWMNSFLKDAYAKKDNDERVKNWILQVTELAYDVEDVIEYVQVKVSSSNKKSTQRYAFWKTWIWKRKVRSKLEGIQQRIAKMPTDLQTWGLSNLESPTTSSVADRQQLLRRTHSHVPVNNEVGLNYDIETLVAKLVGEDSNGRQVKEHRVISICGMGGLGKTTLAKKIYDDPRIKAYFTCLVWIYISREWVGREREILEMILFKLISPSKEQWEEIKKLEHGGVARMLYKELEKTRCLVVFDDIWEADIWKILSAGFPAEGTTSKIILTTRNREVGIKVDPRCYIHEPQLLNSDDSLELFQRIAIFGRDETALLQESFNKLGKEMVKHCKGLPLAIIVLGGLLATKQTIPEWDTAHENIKSYLKGRGKDSFGILEVLALSYDDLPQRLKACFLYLAKFPEDHRIHAKKLVNLWIAEGIIPTVPDTEGEETLEDIAYGFLEELAQRYIIIVEKRSYFGWIKTCGMHDLMRDLCVSEAKKHEFLTLVNVNDRNQHLGFLSSAMVSRGAENRKMRRFSVTFSSHCNKHIASGGTEISSIWSFSGYPMDPYSGIGQELMNSIAKEFKSARVLDLENVKGFAIPENIGKLLHLRLLDVSSAWIGELSSSLGELCFLLTLYLDRKYSASKLPDVFWKMKQLRHLYLPPSCGNRTEKLRFADLSHLQTLVNFPASCADMKDLITLSNLRKLVVMVEDLESLNKFVEIFEPSKVDFSHLRSVAIKSDRYTVQHMMELSKESMRKILSCCPRLHRLKLGSEVVYRKSSVV